MRWIQYGVVAQLAVICVINYMDRITLAIANPAVRHDMGLSLSEMGLLLAVFQLPYALSQVPGGPVIDRFGARRVLGIGLALWSAAQGMAGLATSAWQIAGCRAALGVGESPVMMCCAKVVRRWFNVRERGRPVGIYTSAQHLGQAIAAPVLTILMLALGWRWMFAIMGLVGIASVIVWFIAYRDPDDARLGEGDHAYLVEGDKLPNVPSMSFAQWRRLFRFRTSWGIWFAMFGSTYMNGLFLTWLPGYLEIERHLSIQQAGFVAALPFAMSVVGGLFAGWAADALLRKGASPFNGPRTVWIVGLFGMALFTVLTAEAPGVVMAVVWLCTAMFFYQFSGTCCWVSMNAAVPENRVGSFGGLANSIGAVGAGIAPLVTGIAVDVTGSFVMPLVVGATLVTAGALALWFMPTGPLTAEDIAGRRQAAFG
jgi:MFS family permease